MSSQTVSILGCGWLGLPIAQILISRGYQVKGSTTASAKLPLLKEQGIFPFMICVDAQMQGCDIDRFFDADILILTIPFKRNLEKPEIYQEQIQCVIHELHQSRIKYVVFTSSTAVYPAANRIFKEDDIFFPDNERARTLLTVEQMLREDKHFDTTILRLGGLYGEDRPPGKFLAGKTNLDQADSPVNLVHVNDAVKIIVAVIVRNIRREILNVCADAHPSRKELYTLAAKKMGVKAPRFIEDNGPRYKIISNEKLKRKLRYRFLHPTPLEDL